jgi:hypothetical protein
MRIYYLTYRKLLRNIRASGNCSILIILLTGGSKAQEAVSSIVGSELQEKLWYR